LRCDYGKCVAKDPCEEHDGSERERARLAKGKALVCHVPPGNPSKAHTLCVGTPAVPAPLAHGDSLGPCQDRCPPKGDGAMPKCGYDGDRCPSDVPCCSGLTCNDGVCGPNAR